MSDRELAAMIAGVGVAGVTALSLWNIGAPFVLSLLAIFTAGFATTMFLLRRPRP